MKQAITKCAIAAAGWLATGAAFAHAGHGMEQPHWHATDLYGFVVVVVLATVALLFSSSE